MQKWSLKLCKAKVWGKTFTFEWKVKAFTFIARQATTTALAVTTGEHPLFAWCRSDFYCVDRTQRGHWLLNWFRCPCTGPLGRELRQLRRGLTKDKVSTPSDKVILTKKTLNITLNATFFSAKPTCARPAHLLQHLMALIWLAKRNLRRGHIWRWKIHSKWVKTD